MSKNERYFIYLVIIVFSLNVLDWGCYSMNWIEKLGVIIVILLTMMHAFITWKNE